MKKSNTQGTEGKEEMLDRTLTPEQIEEFKELWELREINMVSVPLFPNSYLKKELKK